MSCSVRLSRRRGLVALVCLDALIAVATAGLSAEDWPEWRGKGRLGVWTETGIVEKLPATLPVKWRVPVQGGYTGPSVANGRVFVTDARRVEGSRRVVERALALDENTGNILWTREWDTDYAGLSFDSGPVATPTVDGNRVYVLGRMGNLLALDVADGRVLWQKDYKKDYKTTVPVWGITGAPLVDGERLICLVGGEGNAKYVAFNKMTGEEVWRALETISEPGYNQPIIIQAAGLRQLIAWHPQAVHSLDPVTGKVYWEVPFSVDQGLTIMTPVQSGPYLFVASHYSGALMLKLDETKPGAKELWARQESDDTINPAIGTPVIQGNYIYGFSSFGTLRCLELATGNQMWESQALIGERSLYATALIVRSGNRYFINNDRGELIIATLSPQGYNEISRAPLIAADHPSINRRRLGFVVQWSHPAYANRHVIARNNGEIVRFSLAKE
jgi:outer membrane protein assembly factor BamB